MIQQPSVLYSPTTTMWNQRGNAFDYSVLLCSLLEGSGYDAYVAYGYASKEICTMDRSRKMLDIPRDSEGETAPIVEKKENKYRLQPVMKLKSTYEAEMAKREQSVTEQSSSNVEDTKQVRVFKL